MENKVDFYGSSNGDWFKDKFGAFHVNIDGEQYLYEELDGKVVFRKYGGPCQSGLTPVDVIISELA